MPYCRKCGAKLEDDAQFCHVCGTPIAQTVAKPETRRTTRVVSRPMTYLAIALICVLVIAVFFSMMIFIPGHEIAYSESHGVGYRPDVKILNLTLTASVASIKVSFEHLADSLVTLNVSATGRAGMFAPSTPLNVTFTNSTTGNVLVVDTNVKTSSHMWPWQWVDVNCGLKIDPAMKVNMNVKTSTGQIIMDTQTGVTINSLTLEAITGSVQANLVENVTINGNVTAKTTTGSVELSWDKANATRNVTVEAKTVTGGVTLDINQKHMMAGNVTLKAQTTTGGVHLTMKIENSIAAKIESATTVGAIDVANKTGFSGTSSLLQSDNYPAKSNFNTSLKTSTGGIHINAKYTP